MSKNFLSISILILSLALIFCGFQICKLSPKNVKTGYTSLIQNKGLLTIEEAAKYLSMSVDELNQIILQQDKERGQLSIYETYQYVPYIKMNDQKYFNITQLNKWIEYNSTTWKYLETE